MQERNALGRLSGLALAGIVVAIFAVGLARGQDDWHTVLLVVGAALQVLAVVYATKRIWLMPLMSLRADRQLELEVERPESPAEDPAGQIRLFALTPEEALLAGAMAVAGVLLILAGNLLV
jgi:hypothetical protein